MLLLTTLSMIRPNSIDDKDNLSAHYIAKRAISEGYTNAGYTLENTTTPKHNTPEKINFSQSGYSQFRRIWC